MRSSRSIRLVTAALLVLAVAGLPAGASAETTAGPPADYTKIEGLSQVAYDDIVKEKYEVPMHDGIKLYVEVTRPNTDGSFPVILEASPYHGTLADREGRRILPEPRDDELTSLGLTGYFAPRGYAVVMVDLRGTGRSEGCLDHLGPKDAKDLKTIVEWAAQQDWSNGRVGMTGHSYVGSTPSAAAAQEPKGLVTIVPSAGLASMYHHQFQDGVPYYLQWMGTMWAYSGISTVRHLPPVGDSLLFGETGDNFGNDMEYAGCGWKTSSATSPGDSQTSGEYTWWHAERDHEAGATAAKIPVFLVHGVNDNAARVAAMEWFTRRNGEVYTEQKETTTTTCKGGSTKGKGKNCTTTTTTETVSGDKLWLGQWDHGSGCCPTRRGIQWTYALHAWFDKHLAQRDVDTGPPVEVFMADGTFSEARKGARTEIYTADSWPGDPRMLEFYPTADNKLEGARPESAGSVSFTGDPRGFASPKSTGGATFSTAALEDDLVLVGQPQLDLVASVTTPRVHLIANLFDEWTYKDDSGEDVTERRRISQFAINPELREGLATPKQPVVPGEKYTLKPSGFAMGHHLREGHKLVLRVTASDPDKVPVFAADPKITVFTGPGGTAVRVPVVDDAVLYPDDMPLVLHAVALGPAQAPIEGSVTTVAAGAGVREPGVTSQFFEFEVLDGYDNARSEMKATVTTPADIDLYLQKKRSDGSWSGDISSGTSFSFSEESISTDRLTPGLYRIEVHNWAGAPANSIKLAITFFNQAGEKGT